VNKMPARLWIASWRIGWSGANLPALSCVKGTEALHSRVSAWANFAMAQ